MRKVIGVAQGPTGPLDNAPLRFRRFELSATEDGRIFPEDPDGVATTTRADGFFSIPLEPTTGDAYYEVEFHDGNRRKFSLPEGSSDAQLSALLELSTVSQDVSVYSYIDQRIADAALAVPQGTKGDTGQAGDTGPAGAAGAVGDVGAAGTDAVGLVPLWTTGTRPEANTAPPGQSLVGFNTDFSPASLEYYDGVAWVVYDGGGASQVPVASISLSGTGFTRAFDGSGSSNPAGGALTYIWDFGDGFGGSGAAPSHDYAAAGSYTATLEVRNAQNLSNEATVQVTIREAAPPPVVNAGGDLAPAEGIYRVQLNGSVTLQSGGPLELAWTLLSGPDGYIPTFFPDNKRYAPYVDLIPNLSTHYQFLLTAIENGQSGSDTVSVTTRAPQVENLLQAPGDLLDPVWEKGGATTINQNAEEGPTGALTAARVTMPDSLGTYFRQQLAVLPGAEYGFELAARVYEGSLSPVLKWKTVANTDISTVPFSWTESWQDYGPYRITPDVDTIRLEIDNGASGAVDFGLDGPHGSSELLFYRIYKNPVSAFGSAQTGLTLSFTSEATADVGLTLTTYTWIFHDGTVASGATTDFTYGGPGNYEVSLKVKDSRGNESALTKIVTVTSVSTEVVEARIQQWLNLEELRDNALDWSTQIKGKAVWATVGLPDTAITEGVPDRFGGNNATRIAFPAGERSRQYIWCLPGRWYTLRVWLRRAMSVGANQKIRFYAQGLDDGVVYDALNLVLDATWVPATMPWQYTGTAPQKVWWTLGGYDETGAAVTSTLDIHEMQSNIGKRPRRYQATLYRNKVADLWCDESFTGVSGTLSVGNSQLRPHGLAFNGETLGTVPKKANWRVDWATLDGVYTACSDGRQFQNQQPATGLTPPAGAVTTELTHYKQWSGTGTDEEILAEQRLWTNYLNTSAGTQIPEPYLLDPLYNAYEQLVMDPGGNDGAAGTSAAPLASYDGAYQRALANRAQGKPTRVAVRGGQYYGGSQRTDKSSGAEIVFESVGVGAATLTGSERFTGWQNVGGIWTHNWPYNFGVYDNGPSGKRPEGIAQRREMVMMRGCLMEGILDRSKLRAGQFYVDEGANTLELVPFPGMNPNTEITEVATNQQLIKHYQTDDITLKGLRLTGCVAKDNQTTLQITDQKNIKLLDMIIEYNAYRSWQASNVTNLTIKGMISQFNGMDMNYIQIKNLAMHNVLDLNNGWRSMLDGNRGYGDANKGFRLHGQADVLTYRDYTVLHSAYVGFWPDSDNEHTHAKRVLVRYGDRSGAQIELSVKPWRPTTLTDCFFADFGSRAMSINTLRGLKMRRVVLKDVGKTTSPGNIKGGAMYWWAGPRGNSDPADIADHNAGIHPPRYLASGALNPDYHGDHEINFETGELLPETVLSDWDVQECVFYSGGADNMILFWVEGPGDAFSKHTSTSIINNNKYVTNNPTPFRRVKIGTYLSFPQWQQQTGFDLDSVVVQP